MEARFLPRRIYGIETELGVAHIAGESGHRLNGDEIARHLFRTVVAWGKSSNVFLGNGSRVYLDVGSHPEYATAECDDLLDLIAHDRAGEATVLELAEVSRRTLAEDHTGGSIYLFKNNTDSHGNTYGCHENYLIGRGAEFGDLAEPLLGFLVSRQLICGAGALRADGSYAISQRAEHMWDGVSSATTRTRPMINTRDEPHADPAKWRRMHVIVGDSNMSETSTLLKVGTTEWVLRLLEQGDGALPEFTLAEPARAIRDIAEDLTGRARVELTDGRTISALELQQAYAAAARELATATGETNATLLRVLDLWQSHLSALAAGDLDALGRDVDWVIKLRLLQRYADRHGLGLDDPRLAQIALAYHDLQPGRGIFRLLEARGQVSRQVSDERVRRAMTEPPATTRAALRGAFVSAANAAGLDHTVDWVTMKINEPATHPWDDPVHVGPSLYAPVSCRDPLRSVDDRVARLLDEIAATGRAVR